MHTRPLLLVAAGGAAGTVLRELATTTSHPLRTTLCVNVLGAVLLGLLLGALIGVERPRTRDLRLVLGVGLLGAFTTWSALAVQTVQLTREGRPGVAVGYLALTLFLGVVGAWAAVGLGSRWRRP